MKWWEHIDILSVEAKLYIHGKNRYVTRLGILLSSLSVLSVSFLAIYFLVIFLQKSQVNVIFFEQNTLFRAYYNLTNTPFYWTLVDQRIQKVDPTFVEIRAGFISTGMSGANLTMLDSQPCGETSYMGKEYQDYTCVKENKYDISISFDPFNYTGSYINLYTMKCANTTSNNNYCKSSKEIDDYLAKSQLYIRYSLPHYSINHFNITNPIETSFVMLQNGVISSLYYYRRIFLKLVNYTTDYGSVMEDKEVITAYGQDSIRSNTEIFGKVPTTINQNTIGVHSFQMSTEYFDNF
jgi:hypothetical protein